MVITATTTDGPKLHLTATKTSFSLPHAEKSTGRIEVLDHGPNSKIDFGAQIYGIDLNHFTNADFEYISDALHKHKLLVFKEQPQMLSPHRKTTKIATNGIGVLIFFFSRAVPADIEVRIMPPNIIVSAYPDYSFDPNETTGGFAHGADPLLTEHNGVKIYGLPKRPAIPVQPQVHILGRGPLPLNHYQFPPNFEVQGIDHYDFHLPPHIPEEDREAGASRFYQWHFDGSLYDIPPPRVGCLLAVKTPKGPDVTVRWDDGTGTEMKIAPGATAMVAGSRALALLDEDTRNIVLNSRIEYAPHAFVWMSTAHSTRLGHLLETEGLEKPLDELPSWSKDRICTYPMVWTNPKTGEKSLQVHGQGALKLYLKNSPNEKEVVITDIREVREFMHKYGY
jgi:alpha-ketoglutarate-dependent taurine dioxygenase